MAGKGIRALIPELLPALAGEALHARVARTLREAIALGTLTEGARLSGHRLLAQQLGVSRNTLVDALGTLEAEGFVEVRGRSGTRVCVPPRLAPPVPAPAPMPLSAWATRALAGGVTDAGGEYLVDFRLGQSVPELYPARAWAQALARRAATPPTETQDDPLGPLETRRALTAYLRAERGAVLTPDMVMLTGGTQSALDALARIFLEEGRLAVIEAATYSGAKSAFLATGASLFPVPLDEGGLQPAALPAQATLLYATPACQYPTTVTLGAARRQRVLEWAARAGTFVLEDDYAADLHHTGRPPAVMQGLAPERVILLGSFSKSLAPVTRSGFVVAPPEVIRVLAATRPLIDRSPSVLDALALADLLASGTYTRHLRGARQGLAHRHDILLGELRQHLPTWQPRPSRAGLHLHVGLPPELSESEALAGAQAHGVALTPSSAFYGPELRAGAKNDAASPTLIQPSVLLAFAHLSPEALRSGVRRLAAALH